ncbi:MAG: M48 family metalloprotease [Gammaproteobacteria bacterium]|nr:M48 family metalloprotease [Gammaproteobacteria bacterium]
MQARIFFFIILFLSASGNAQGFTNAWDISELAKANTNQIELRNSRRTILKRVDTNQMRFIYAVKTSIEKVAEVETTLILVDGDQPNAFAGKVEGNRNVIGFNFAMLDIIGMDMHMMAAIIGHELAHLKLEHGNDQEKRAYGGALAKILGTVALGGLGMGAYGAMAISDLGVSMANTKYSRDNERESDYLGAIWAVEAGFEPEGAVRVHEEMYKLSKGGPMPFLSTHPSGPERIATLKALSSRLSKKGSE